MTKEKKPFEFYFITVLFSLLITVCFLQVLFRLVLNLPLAWTEELSRYIFIILVYLGASVAAKENKHVRIELIDNIVNPKVKRILDFIVKLLCAFSCLLISFNIKNLIINSFRANQLSAALRLPMAFLYLLVGGMFLLIAIRFLQNAYIILKNKEEKTSC